MPVAAAPIRVAVRGRRAGGRGQARRPAGDRRAGLAGRSLRTGPRRQPSSGARLWVVHRLDRDTSGALAFARSAAAHRACRWPSSVARCTRPTGRWSRACRSLPAGAIDLPMHQARRGKTRPARAGEAGAREAVDRLPRAQRLARPRPGVCARRGAAAHRPPSPDSRALCVPSARRSSATACTDAGHSLAPRRAPRARLALHASRLDVPHPADAAACVAEAPWPAASEPTCHQWLDRALDHGAGVVRLTAVVVPDRALDRLVRACDLPFTLAPADATLDDGALVRLESRRGSAIGLAIVDRAGECWRLMTRAGEPWTSLGDAWLDARLDAALAWRTAAGLVGPDATFRLVHGAGDALPGLYVDVYGAFAVVSALTPALRAGGRRAGAAAGGSRPGRRRGGEASRPRRGGAAGRGRGRGRRPAAARATGRARRPVALRGAPGAPA